MLWLLALRVYCAVPRTPAMGALLLVLDGMGFWGGIFGGAIASSWRTTAPWALLPARLRNRYGQAVGAGILSAILSFAGFWYILALGFSGCST